LLIANTLLIDKVPGVTAEDAAFFVMNDNIVDTTKK
jgi:hypothetical protein